MLKTMNKQELEDKYMALYDYMANSKKSENMKAFGHVMSQMMEWFIENKPDMAEEYIDKLESIKWKNYLTRKEAATIVNNMVPAAKWPMDIWKAAMEKMGVLTEEEPCYNSCALWVAMNMVYSDDIRTIAGLMGKTVDSMTPEEMVKATHAFAINKLKDTDGVFKIRRYFGLT